MDRGATRIDDQTGQALSVAATVMRDGTVMAPTEAGEEAAFFERHPVLAEHARRLLWSGRTNVRYSYISEDDVWHLVSIHALPDGFGDQLGRVVVQRTKPPFRLTLRELDVLTLMTAGHANQHIADCLDIKLRTVTTHVERILVKMGRLSRTAAATVAVDFGLLRLPTPGGGRNLQPLTVGLLDDGEASTDSRSGETVHRRGPTSAPRPLVIGTPLSLKGLAASDAREMMMSARLAVQEINAAGGVLGRPLELREMSCDIGDAEDVGRAVKSLIDHEVDAIASGYSAAEIQIQEMMADYGAPYLHCATMEAMVDRVRQDPDRLSNIFQICPSDISYGPRFIQFLDQLSQSGQWNPHSNRVVVIQPRWSQMDVGLRRVEQMADRRGLKLEIIDDLPAQGIDWSQVMRRVHAADPCAVFLAYYFPEENIAFLRNYLADPGRALVYTLYGPSVPAYREELGAAAEGVIWATTTGRAPSEQAQNFANRFEKMHGKPPGHSHAGLAYDRVHLLARAWHETGDPRGFRSVCEAIRRLPYRGVNGMYFMDNAGQSVSAPDPSSVDPSLSHPHLIFQIQNGQQALLSPSPEGQNNFRTPPWIAGKRYRLPAQYRAGV
ncbi:ABC transporter substrate-binding protein [Pseudooceanicola batsensis]|uniref:ABC transporter substrate-binding protein n=1 Tax=Pseudooceanicola batsensis TaxID=314255 RepID=UPI001375711F|nr:ABC transporter substrate-binding protein [Pseudooceanicola batsensis]